MGVGFVVFLVVRLNAIPVVIAPSLFAREVAVDVLGPTQPLGRTQRFLVGFVVRAVSSGDPFWVAVA